jgi:hypothetical protein
MVYEGKLTTTEAWTAMVIDSYVDPKGEGCWLSNAKMAKRMHVQVRQVNKIIKKLKEIGIVKQVGWKMVNNLKFRILETAWSRVYIYTDVINDMGTHVINDMESNTDTHSSYQSYEKKNSCPPRSARGNTVPLIPNTSNETSPSKKIVSRLIKFITKNRLQCRTPQPIKWNKDIKELLLTRTPDEVNAVIDWLDQLKTKKIHDKYFPQICSASSFVEKYTKLEKHMREDEDYSPPINISIYFITTIEKGKVVKTQLGLTDERPVFIYERTRGNIFRAIDVEKLIQKGKPLPPWHWDNPKSFNRKAYVTEGVKL